MKSLKKTAILGYQFEQYQSNQEEETELRKASYVMTFVTTDVMLTTEL